MRLHVLVCCCVADQYTKVTGIFLRFQNEKHVLRVNKSEITDENTFSKDDFETERNDGSSKDEKTLLWVFLQICDQCFNP